MAWRAPSAEPSPRRRGPTGGVVAIVVLVLMCLLWWLFSGNGPSGPDGNAQRLGVPDTEATGTPGATSDAVGTIPGAVRIDGYVPEAGNRVTVTYTTGPARCVGVLDTPRVLETDAAVTVTLVLVAPTPSPRACRDVAVLHSVTIALDAPLEGRSLLDGSRPQAVRIREDPTGNQ